MVPPIWLLVIITLKIAWSSGVASVFSPLLSIALHDIPLSTSFDNIKSAFGNFGIVTSVKLKPAGLWQYVVVHFKDISSAAAVLTHWSVLVKKDSIRILPLVNQKEVIASRDAFKAKLVNFSFGCTAFEISDLVSQVGGCTCFIPHFPDSKFYAKAAADMNLDLGGPPPITTLLLSVASSAFNNAVETRLASLESHFVNYFYVLVKESVTGLVEQNKGLAAIAIVIQKKMTCLEKKCEQACLEDMLDNNDIDDNNNDDVKDKNFSVYNNMFDVMMHL
ncbi:hypothetical protein G9A89_016020 [Geosiphon pyriformis]|nr:hypothetical protein G9A89_016020 [Geosiphon pyriformis]